MVNTLYDWWQSKRRLSSIPDRSDVDPIALKDLLPNIFIAEAEHEPFRIRYRLVGTKATAVIGFETTGCYLDELQSAEPGVPWIEYYRTVYLSRAPLFGSITWPTEAGGTFSYEFGIFPLRKGGDAVEQFIALEDYFGASLLSKQMHPRRPQDQRE